MECCEIEKWRSLTFCKATVEATHMNRTLFSCCCCCFNLRTRIDGLMLGIYFARFRAARFRSRRFDVDLMHQARSSKTTKCSGGCKFLHMLSRNDCGAWFQNIYFPCFGPHSLGDSPPSRVGPSKVCHHTRLFAQDTS